MTKLRLADVCEIEAGRYQLKRDAQGSVPIIGGWTFHGKQRNGPPPGGEPVANQGDVVIHLLGDPKPGHVVGRKFAGSPVARECVILRPTLKGLTGATLAMWTWSPEFRSQMAGACKGTVVKRVSSRALYDFAFSMPTPESLRVGREGLAVIDSTRTALGRTMDELDGRRDELLGRLFA